jgi:hypothetical protein
MRETERDLLDACLAVGVLLQRVFMTMSRKLGGEQYRIRCNCTLYLAVKNLNVDIKNTDIYVKCERNVRPFL